MSDDDSGSEDIDYNPSKKEIKEAKTAERRQKRQKLQTQEGKHPAKAGASAKADEVWQQLRGGSQRASGGDSFSLAALCRSRKSGGTSAADREWTRQLGIVPPASERKLQASLKNRAAVTASPVSEAAAASLNTSVAAKAIAAAKTAMVDARNAGKVSVLETRRFAGKDVQVRKLADSQDTRKSEEHEKEKKNAGLDAVLASLETAKKVNVLDKSRDDWGTFKSQDAQVAQELEAYKKSGDKYLDKVDFLKRSELREFEAEREKRLGGDTRTRIADT